MIISLANDTDQDDAAPARAGVLGAVFCGGQSRRMGVDKARLELGGRTLLDTALHATGAVAERVVLASGKEPRYADTGRDEVQDRFDDGGPLAGLEAVLRVAADEGADWVVAVACDMPALDAAVLERLLDEAEARGADACLLESAEGIEPLYAVYSPRCHVPVLAALERGERRMIAFHADVQVVTLAVKGASARNVNTPEDLRSEREVQR